MFGRSRAEGMEQRVGNIFIDSLGGLGCVLISALVFHNYESPNCWTYNAKLKIFVLIR